MEEVYEKNCETLTNENEQIIPRVLRGNMRSYFLDVHSTQEKDLYITITESKKCFDAYGHYFYERHKIFLFKDDFKEFVNGLTDVMNMMESNEFDIDKIQKRDHAVLEKKKSPVFIKKNVKKDFFEGFENEDQRSESASLKVEFEDLSVPQ